MERPPGKCAHCGQRASMRCSRCKVLRLCSLECFRKAWQTHKPDCDAIKTGLDLNAIAGVDLTSAAGESVMLQIRPDDYISLISRGHEVRERHRTTEQRLHANDPTLTTNEKVAFYCDMMKVYDSSSEEHAGRTLVQKMLLNRRYNAFHIDAGKRLQPHELEQLTREQARQGIGKYFKSLREL